MIKTSGILCPLALTGNNDAAFNYALAVARCNQASLTVLHVVAARTQFNRAEPSRARQLSELRYRARMEGISIHVAVAHGDPAASIKKYAAERAVDLIVLNTISPRGLMGFRLGAITRRVLEDRVSPTIFLNTRFATERLSGNHGVRIVCAADFTPRTAKVIRHATTVRHPRDSVTVLQIADATGNPHQEILRAASELRADLLVMGSACRGRLRGSASITSRVVRDAACGVLVIP